MPADRRTLRDIRSAYRGMRRYQREAGQWSQWFRFNKAGTTSDPTYGTGPGRVWYPSVTIPVLIGEYQRAGQNFDDDGLYLVDRLTLVMSYNDFYNSGIPDPDPSAQNHVNDRVAFDGRLFAVDTFIPKGRVASYFLTITVTLREVAQSELDEDVDSSMFDPYSVVGDG